MISVRRLRSFAAVGFVIASVKAVLPEASGATEIAWVEMTACAVFAAVWHQLHCECSSADGEC